MRQLYEAKMEFLPRGEGKKERDNAKGHLLEKLIFDYLETCGYCEIQLNEHVDGTEWDVHGRAALSGAPVIVSCKCLSSSVSPGPIKELGFDVTNLIESEPTISGVLVAIPKLSPDSKEYLRNINKSLSRRIRVLEESDLIRELSRQHTWCAPDTIKTLARQHFEKRTGDTRLLYSDNGAYWCQLLFDDEESRIPKNYTLYNINGTEVSNQEIVQSLQSLMHTNGSDLVDLSLIRISKRTEQKHAQVNIQAAHETTHGIGWFDYRYPAPPECFAGREVELRKFYDFIQLVKEEQTTSRVFIVTGISGIGKSSIIFKFRELAQNVGGKLVTINCMSAKGKSFILSSILRLLGTLEQDPACSSIVSSVDINGIDSLAETLSRKFEKFREVNVIPILVFDQFETAMLDGPLTEALVEFVMAIEELKANIIICFAWKTDLWWPDDHVPYSAREQLRRTATIIQLDQFGSSETNVLLRALSKEIGQPLLPELANELRVFSRGYPWLLKKVCWHVLMQIKKGVQQKEILNRRLELRTLFEADLDELDEPEKDYLKKIATVLPADGRTITEAFPDIGIPRILNKFIEMRLIIRQGDTYNIYHDIFKEFLRTGRVPIEESYLLRVSPGKSLDIVRIIADYGHELSVTELSKLSKMKSRSLLNYLQSLSAIGLVSTRKGKVSLHEDIRSLQTQDDLIREARLRLVRNACVKEILRLFSETDLIKIESVVVVLKNEFPSLPAQTSTWISYARNMIRWLNYVKAAGSKEIIIQDEISEKRLVGPQSTAEYPEGQVRGVIRLVDILDKNNGLKKIDIATKAKLSYKTIEKALVDARLLGFCERLIDGGWRLTEIGTKFAKNDMREQRKIFKEQLEKIPFVSEYLTRQSQRPYFPTKHIITQMLNEKGKTVRPATLQTISTVIKNWCNYANRRGETGKLPLANIQINTEIKQSKKD